MALVAARRLRFVFGNGTCVPQKLDPGVRQDDGDYRVVCRVDRELMVRHPGERRDPVLRHALMNHPSTTWKFAT